MNWLNIFKKKVDKPIVNALQGKRLRYLIGFDGPYPTDDQHVVEVSYDAEKPQGVAIAYCNLFDERGLGTYGPYLSTSDTARAYREGQIDPRGPGWTKNLRDQFERRKSQGFELIEVDNPDAYETKDVLGAYDLAASYGFKIIAKNPEICEDGGALVAHPAVVGVVVEEDCGTPEATRAMCGRVDKDRIPIWFVCFGSGKAWGIETAEAIVAQATQNATVSYSPIGEYCSSVDLE